MKKIEHLIERIFTKKNIKIFLLLFIVVWFFVWTSFAQSEGTVGNMTLVQKLSHCMNVLISILSWVWVIFATLAWKFMTNDFVYGTFLHLDKALWNLWNIMKNFANIALWCILVFAIVKNIFTGSFWDKTPIQNVKDTVIHTLIAWVLIQMSWFLMAALFDISTIATVAVWALPSQFMATNNDFQGNMRNMVAKSNKKLIVDFGESEITKVVNANEDATEDEINKFLDTISPSSETVVWPLLFLWASVFDMYNLSDSSKNLGGTDDRWDLLLSLWINWIVMISFTLMLALMFLFNLFRVVTLWIVIPFTPFIILFSAFKGEWKNLKLNDFLWDITDYSKIIKLVFKPVYMTLVLSVILVVMVLVRSLIKANGSNINLGNDNITVQSKQIWDTEKYNSSMDIVNVANIEMHGMKETFTDLLIYFLWLALMGMLMKSCFTWEVTWIKFIDNKIEWLSNILWGKKWELWWLIWNMWVLPIWKDENGKPVKVWLWAAWNYVSTAQDRLDRRLDDKEAAQDSAIRKALWLNKITGDFDSLRNERDRDKWIKSAARIWQIKWYETESHFKNNESFWGAYEYFNSEIAGKSGGRIQPLKMDEIMKELEKLNNPST